MRRYHILERGLREIIDDAHREIEGIDNKLYNLEGLHKLAQSRLEYLIKLATPEKR